MREQGPESAAALDAALRESLSSLGKAMAEVCARSVSVCVWERRGSLRLLCQFPETEARPEPRESKNGWYDSLQDLGGFTPADSPTAKFLAAACHLQPSSFVLFSWGAHRHTAIVAFGFAPGTPLATFPQHVSSAAQLAAVAAWCVTEIARLRGEVATVSERLGTRKLVEQAKRLLQVDQDLDEPEAYAYLRKLSRQRRIRMADIARDLLKAADLARTSTSP
jgi:ANTAR domain-containing protein